MKEDWASCCFWLLGGWVSSVGGKTPGRTLQWPSTQNATLQPLSVLVIIFHSPLNMDTILPKPSCPYWHPCSCLCVSYPRFVSYGPYAMALLTTTGLLFPLHIYVPSPPAAVSLYPCLQSLRKPACWLLAVAHLTDTVLQALCCIGTPIPSACSHT